MHGFHKSDKLMQKHFFYFLYCHKIITKADLLPNYPPIMF